MLHLKRVQYFTDFMKCKVSGEIIKHGDYYYEDDEDGMIIKASVYGKMKKEKQENEFDYTKLNQAENLRDYEQSLKEYEREFLKSTLFDRTKMTYGGPQHD